MARRRNTLKTGKPLNLEERLLLDQCSIWSIADYLLQRRGVVTVLREHWEEHIIQALPFPERFLGNIGMKSDSDGGVNAEISGREDAARARQAQKDEPTLLREKAIQRIHRLNAKEKLADITHWLRARHDVVCVLASEWYRIMRLIPGTAKDKPRRLMDGGYRDFQGLLGEQKLKEASRLNQPQEQVHFIDSLQRRIRRTF
jgi:hypothetical protein